MKKLLLLLLLCPVLAIAKTILPGTITFNDNTTRTGLIEIQDDHKQQRIFFKTDKKAKKETISIDDVQFYVVSNEADEQIKFYTLKLAVVPNFSTKYKVSDKKSWVRLEKAGEVNIITAWNANGAVYYLHKPHEDFARYLITLYGENGCCSHFKMFKFDMERIFKDDCPDLVKALETLDKDEFRANGPFLAAMLFAQYCDIHE